MLVKAGVSPVLGVGPVEGLAEREGFDGSTLLM